MGHSAGEGTLRISVQRREPIELFGRRSDIIDRGAKQGMAIRGEPEDAGERVVPARLHRGPRRFRGV